MPRCVCSRLTQRSRPPATPVPGGAAAACRRRRLLMLIPAAPAGSAAQQQRWPRISLKSGLKPRPLLRDDWMIEVSA